MSGFFVFLLVAGGAIYLLTNLLFGQAGWSSAFEQIALRYGGLYHPANLFRPPAATFPYRQTGCRVRCFRRRLGARGRYTEFRIGWPTRNLRIEIVRTGQAPRLRRLQPVSADRLWGPGFSGRFQIFSNDPERAAKLLSTAVGWQIDQLTTVKPDTGLSVILEKGWLTITRPDYVRSKDAVDDFVRFSLELFDQMALTTSTGIEFHDDVVPVVENLQCPVCSCDIEGRMVLCVRCKTPHCHDCWLYNGKCGMYGCNETRYTMLPG
jgi:hypothetical protein